MVLGDSVGFTMVTSIRLMLRRWDDIDKFVARPLKYRKMAGTPFRCNPRVLLITSRFLRWRLISMKDRSASERQFVSGQPLIHPVEAYPKISLFVSDRSRWRPHPFHGNREPGRF
jgi:hypothetical protein